MVSEGKKFLLRSDQKESVSQPTATYIPVHSFENELSIGTLFDSGFHRDTENGCAMGQSVANHLASEIGMRCLFERS